MIWVYIGIIGSGKIKMRVSINWAYGRVWKVQILAKSTNDLCNLI
jgi:hypothetical protein